MRTSRPPNVGFWPSPVDTSDESWRRQRLAGEEAQQRYRCRLALLSQESKVAASTMASELQNCEQELWHARRSLNGLWASRRVLVDEVRSLREQRALLSIDHMHHESPFGL